MRRRQRRWRPAPGEPEPIHIRGFAAPDFSPLVTPVTFFSKGLYLCQKRGVGGRDSPHAGRSVPCTRHTP